MSELQAATMPNSPEAERCVLGAMLQDPASVIKAAEDLQPEDFYDSGHREIFEAMMSLYSMQRPVDLTTVNVELTRRGSLEGIGGTAYLIGLRQYVPTTANVDAYIAVVAEKSTLRRLIIASQSIIQDSYSQQNPVTDVLNHAEKSIFDIVMKRGSSEALKPIREVLLDTFNTIEDLDRLKGDIAGVPTGFRDLDNLLTGLHPGELILIGARPSMGKTSFAINIATYAGLAAKRNVAFFSLEMPREQIAMRMLCGEAHVDMQRVRQGNLSMDDWDRLINAINPLAASNIFIDDTAGITPTQLRSRCRRLMMDHGLDLVVLDYLGLMRIDGRAENRQLEVSEISRSLKAIALDLKIPLIACAQLSRAPTARSEKRPQLSDLRDSGSIEQDADVVMFLHREAYYDPNSDEKNVGEVIISKQRNGPLGTVKLAWLSEFASYANLLPQQDGQEKPY
ncbi:MAG: replicative DNA helicase [Clostridia bacterium]|nr:replicative DNA helicase [Clostridia bacterium]